MDGYQGDQVPFYTGPNSLVLAFKGLSRLRENRPVILVSHLLLHTTYQEQFPQVLDAVLNTGLEKVRTEGSSACLVEILVDLSAAPEQYTVLHVMDTTAGSTEAELRHYLEEAVALVARKPAPRSERYQVDEDPFYISANATVRLFKGTAERLPVIVKQHDFSVFQENDNWQSELTKAINTALAQVRVQHPNTCRVLELHLDVSRAPKWYCLSHILEALDTDVGKEVAQRRKRQRPLSDWELWDFLQQTARALAYAHAKVIHT
ncbi:MAG: protein kinase family protein [Actinobacteria bacterium]|nr:protein kinase family protein [Actinomycetota bacterium]